MKKKVIRLLILIEYSAVILILVLNHEYWFDEGQAWNIARDNNVAGIFGMIKYEGHPPLWHLILKIFTSLGCSWRALGLISWGFATATAAVIIFALPIKPYLKAALLLSGGMLYTNAVISRVYVLIMFLLAVLAAVYPRRKKHPVVFGVLVALLANTHICMCGLVGIIGIFMLIDYFKDLKGNSARQNIFNTLGLAIAGAGVIALVVPLLDSLSTNSLAAENEYTLSGMASAFSTSLPNIVRSGCAPDFPEAMGFVLALVTQLLLGAACVFLRKNRRALAMELVFTLFYMVLTEVIWYTTPNRGALFLYTLVLIYAMCRDEPLAEGNKTPAAKDGGKLAERLLRMDGNTEKTVSALLAAVLLITAPSGIAYAARDLFGEFAPFKGAAEFIEENIPEDALIVSDSDGYSAVLVYLPERRFYALDYGRFYTYCSHEKRPENIITERSPEIFDEYGEVYYIRTAYAESEAETAVYFNTNTMNFVLDNQTILIERLV